jgi:hypothetical protein
MAAARRAVDAATAAIDAATETVRAATAAAQEILLAQKPPLDPVEPAASLMTTGIAARRHERLNKSFSVDCRTRRGLGRRQGRLGNQPE